MKTAKEIIVLIVASTVACTLGIFLQRLMGLIDREGIYWELWFFFPWREPLKAAIFYPILKWLLKRESISSSISIFILAGALFSVFSSFTFFWGVVLISNLSRLTAELASQTVVTGMGLLLTGLVTKRVTFSSR